MTVKFDNPIFFIKKYNLINQKKTQQKQQQQKRHFLWFKKLALAFEIPKSQIDDWKKEDPYYLSYKWRENI